MAAPKHIKPKKEAAPEATEQMLKLAKAQLQAKAKLDKATEAKDKAQQDYDNIRKKLLPAAMEAIGIDAFKGAEGGGCHLRNKTYFNVLVTNRAKFHAWLKKHKLGDVIKPTVHPQTQNATLQNYIEEGGKLPAFISTHDEVIAVVTAPKK